MRIFDISPPVSATTAVFPGDTPFSLAWTMRRDRGDACSVSELRLSAHVGAHVDAPCHVLDTAKDGGAPARIGELPLDPFLGVCRVVEAPPSAALDRACVSGWPLEGVTRVLIRTRTGIDPTVFPRDGAYFTAEGAAALAGRVVLVGLDTASVDHWESKELPAHRVLFAGGVAILEGLDLSAVAPGDYELIALPLRLVEADASPVRAVLRDLPAPTAPSR